jgi:hypothetical protein
MSQELLPKIYISFFLDEKTVQVLVRPAPGGS